MIHRCYSKTASILKKANGKPHKYQLPTIFSSLELGKSLLWLKLFCLSIIKNLPIFYFICTFYLGLLSFCCHGDIIAQSHLFQHLVISIDVAIPFSPYMGNLYQNYQLLSYTFHHEYLHNIHSVHKTYHLYHLNFL